MSSEFQWVPSEIFRNWALGGDQVSTSIGSAMVHWDARFVSAGDRSHRTHIQTDGTARSSGHQWDVDITEVRGSSKI